MADHYSKLTEAEKAYWDIYTRLRELSDWDGFTDGQRARADDARSWLVTQRKEIWRAAQDSGWEKNDRRERFAQLKDESLNNGSCRRLCQLPTNGLTPTEKTVVSEREMWWRVSTVDAQTHQWRTSNAGWCVERRQKIHALAEDEGWDKAERKLRWTNLCVATKTGKAYDAWAATHNPETGDEKPRPGGGGGGSSRDRAVANCRKYLGVNEKPAGSNRGDPQPSGWQRRVIGTSGYAWCACFTTCMAWDSGVTGSGSAGVAVIVDMAKRGAGMFRGWTTDPSRVKRGDMAVISCTSCHIGMVVDENDPYHTIEGNTSPGDEGSQFNGGCVAERHRRGAIVGWALVDYP